MVSAKPQIDHFTITSIFRSLQTSDVNTKLIIEVIAEDFDVRNLASPPSNSETGFSQSGLSVYLTAAHAGASATLTHFLTDRAFSDVNWATHTSVLIPTSVPTSKNGLMFALSGGNDVVWALLSPNPDALKTLLSCYQSALRSPNLNGARTLPLSHSFLKDEEADYLRPLDVAVQYYVAQRTFERSVCSAISKQIGQAQAAIETVFEQYKAEGKHPPAIVANFDHSVMDRFNAHNTEKDILRLLSWGAIGSEDVYFPVSDDSLLNPFTAPRGYERMSLLQFCQRNAELLSPRLSVLLGTNNDGKSPSPA